MSIYDFQYCQKIIVLSKDKSSVLLCKRKGEQDFDGVFSFIGGKLEITDHSILDGLKREKDEEVGEAFKILICPQFSFNIHYIKKDGSSMILPHYIAIHKEGMPRISEEYSDYKWVNIAELEKFEPKIPRIYEVLNEMLRIEKIAKKEEYVLI